MKPGEYFVAGFVLLMLITFFSIFVWFQIKRIRKQKTANQFKDESNV